MNREFNVILQTTVSSDSDRRCLGGISMTRQYDFSVKFHGPGGGGIEVIDLEPQQDSVPATRIVGVANPSVMIFLVPVVQLKNEPSLNLQPFVVRPAVRTDAIQ
jgi:hypothetical protein